MKINVELPEEVWFTVAAVLREKFFALRADILRNESVIAARYVDEPTKERHRIMRESRIAQREHVRQALSQINR